jgi:hypothetical protein
MDTLHWRMLSNGDLIEFAASSDVWVGHPHSNKSSARLSEKTGKKKFSKCRARNKQSLPKVKVDGSLLAVQQTRHLCIQLTV